MDVRNTAVLAVAEPDGVLTTSETFSAPTLLFKYRTSSKHSAQVGHAFYARHSQGQIWQLTFGLPTIDPSSNAVMSGNDKAVARPTY
jgi:hypothetical protein